jgi:hypothetical protein
VLRSLHSFFAVLVLAVLAPRLRPEQTPKPKSRPRPRKTNPTNDSPHLEKFGKTCDPFNQKFGKSGPPANRPMKPTSIAELMGAPIEVVNIRSYGPGWKNPEDVQNLITKLLKTQTSGVYTYEPWAEAAFAASIATVQFSDHSEGTLEVSGVHVCFSDHSRLALWLRVFRNK